MDEDVDVARRKRTKYVSKACAECKRRKIKCDGDCPCLHCRTLQTHCEYIQGKARGGARRQGQQRADEVQSDGHCLDRIFCRLQAVEERLDMLLSRSNVKPVTAAIHQSTAEEGIPSRTPDHSGLCSATLPAFRAIFEPPGLAVDNHQLIRSSDGQGPRPLTSPAFYGHASSVGNLSNLRHQLTNLTSSNMPEQLHYSRSHCLVNEVYARRVARTTLLPKRRDCFAILDTMFEDLISMYPLLHRPTFIRRYAPLWNDRGDFQPDVAAGEEFALSELGLLYACLAASVHNIGPDAEFSCENNAQRAHQWYVSARVMVLDLKIEQVADLESVQAMLMLSLHFLHVENEDASYKVTGIAVRAAYEIGLHLAARERGLPQVKIELRRRTWWCLYLMDRRTSISTGRPCGIQDRDSDVDYPTALDDQSLFPAQMESPMVLKNSKVPYLCQFVKFSSLCGEIYACVFGVKCQWPPKEHVVLALDNKLRTFQLQLPDHLKFDQSTITSKPTWLAKQALFLMLRCAHVRLLLFRPFATGPESVHDDDHILAGTALQICSEVIYTIYNVKRTSNLVERLWYPCKQILLGCIGITFCTVLNSRSLGSSKTDLHIALQLLKDFDEKSSNQEDVKFLRYSLHQALKARNQTYKEVTGTQMPAPTPIVASPMVDYDLSFLGTADEFNEQQLLMDLLEPSSDLGTDEFVMHGDELSRRGMLSF